MRKQTIGDLQQATTTFSIVFSHSLSRLELTNSIPLDKF
jgi:hypothetical protein